MRQLDVNDYDCDSNVAEYLWFGVHQDVRQSVRLITDAAGAVVETYDYDEYGVQTIKDNAGQPINASRVGNILTFTGREWDAETGLYYFRARHYDPVHGAFLQRDPLGARDAFCLYAYCANSPFTWTDPSGMGFWDWVEDRWEDVKTGGTALAGAAYGVVDSALMDVLPDDVGNDTFQAGAEVGRVIETVVSTASGVGALKNVGKLGLKALVKHSDELADAARSASHLLDDGARAAADGIDAARAGANQVDDAAAALAKTGDDVGEAGAKAADDAAGQAAKNSDDMGEASCKAGGDAPAAPKKTGGENPYTKHGRDEHKRIQDEYKAKDPDWSAEHKLDDGKRVDLYNTRTGEVLEIKPDNARAVRQGEKQVEGYAEKLRSQGSPVSSTGVITYPSLKR